MTRDELAAVVMFMLTNPIAADMGKRVAADTIMKAVDNYVEIERLRAACEVAENSVRIARGEI